MGQSEFAQPARLEKTCNVPENPLRLRSTLNDILRLMVNRIAIMLCVVSSGACSPTGPSKFSIPPGAYQSVFTNLKGEGGFAAMSVTPKAIPEATMAADISVRLVGMRPNATYLFQRAQEGVGGRPLGSDGICQRGLGLSPWS